MAESIMRINVVNYNELFPCPSEAQVIQDIIDIFNKAREDCKVDMGTKLISQIYGLLEDSSATIIDFIDTNNPLARKKIVSCLNENHPDLLITYNLAGFENRTLTGLIAYNLVDCRQFHIVTHDYDIVIDSNELKSLNMFFFKKDNQRFVELNENTDI